MDIHSTSPAGSVIAMFQSHNRVYYSLQIFEDKLGNQEVGPQRDLRNTSSIDLQLFHLCLGNAAAETEVGAELGTSQWIHGTEHKYLR